MQSIPMAAIRCWIWLGFLAAVAPAWPQSTSADTHPLTPALRFVRESREAIRAVKDYEALFLKREVVGKNVSQHKMRIKVRHEPFSVYLWFFEPNEGREVIYVDGRNEGKLLAHETGIKSIAGTVALAPTSPQALAESRYPITRIGMAHMVEAVIRQWEDAARFAESEVKYYRNASLGDVKCEVVECAHPQPRRELKFHLTRVFVDKTTRFPIRVEQYGFPARPGDKPPLLEEYTYLNIKADVGLKDIDFDVSNPKYGF